MEARRLAILCSHLRPLGLSTDHSSFLRLRFSGSPCTSSSSSSSSDRENQLRATQKEKLQDDCIFCKIIRGESPAFKVVAAMCSKVPFLSNALKNATGCGMFGIMQIHSTCWLTMGELPDKLYFIHIHIIPRKAYDCLWTSESLQRRLLNLDGEASQLVARVQEQLLPSEDNCHDSKNQNFCPSKD